MRNHPLHPEAMAKPAPSRRAVIALTLSLLLSFSAHAGGSAVGEQSASAAGQGGTGAARPGDPSAAWYNPAALADGEGWRTGAGMLAISPSIEARAADGSWSSRTQSPVKTPPHVYLSFARRDLLAGVSVNVPFGSSVMWPDEWQGRYESVDSILQVVRVAPFAGYRMGRVRVAAGPHVDIATLALHRKLDMVDTQGDVRLDLAGTGIGAHAALFVDASDSLALGFVAKSRTVLPLRGNADFETPDAFTGKAPDQRASTEITVPDLFTAGVAWRPSSRWTLSGDVGVATWDVWDEIRVDFSDDETPDNVTKPAWQTTVSLRAGVERQLGSRAVVRGGLVYDPSPAPASTLAPNAPDADRTGVTAGLGLRVREDLSVDAFYEYLHLAARRSANPESLDATYGGRAHFAGAGLRWRFGGR